MSGNGNKEELLMLLRTLIGCVVILAVAMLSTGCATPNTTPTTCLLYQPIHYSEDDLRTMTPELAEQIAEHNEIWDRLCD